MIESMRGRMIAAMQANAPRWSELKLGGAVWYTVGTGRADRIILQDDRFTASSPEAIRILDDAVHAVQQPAITNDTLSYVSLVTGELVEVSTSVITSIHLMIAPEARKTKSVDQAAFAVAEAVGLVAMLGEHHVGPTESGHETLRLMELLRPRT